MNHKNIYSFLYRGIPVEIHNWGENLKNWNYYIYIWPKNVGIKTFKKSFTPKLKKVNWGGPNNKIYDMYSCPILNDLEFHGGMTYLNIEMVNGQKFLKAGCDYSHLYDNETDWNEKILQTDAKNTINELHELTPVFVRCRGNGNYYLEEDGIYMDVEKSDFRSFEYQKYRGL